MRENQCKGHGSCKGCSGGGCNSSKVEVVRCKDCRQWKPSKSYGLDLDDTKRFYGECTVTGRSEREDHYCSYGERKEKND